MDPTNDPLDIAYKGPWPPVPRGPPAPQPGPPPTAPSAVVTPVVVIKPSAGMPKEPKEKGHRQHTLLEKIKHCVDLIQRFHGNPARLERRCGQLRRYLDAARSQPELLHSNTVRLAEKMLEQVESGTWFGQGEASLPTGIVARNPGMPPTSEKMVALIHGDAWIEGSGLEGEGDSVILAYLSGFFNGLSLEMFNKLLPAAEQISPDAWKAFLKDLSGAQDIAENQDELAQGHRFRHGEQFQEYIVALKQYSNDMASLVGNTLKGRDHFVVPAGWMAEPMGHAAAFEVNKQPDGLYSVCVCNRGRGNQYHGPPTVRGLAWLWPSGLILSNVSKERLCNPLFWRGVLEMNTSTECEWQDGSNVGGFPKKTDYNEVDLYEGVLPMLGGVVDQTHLTQEDLQTAQKGGTCSIKWVSMVLRRRFGYHASKLGIYLLKQHSLWALVKSERGSIVKPGTVRTVFYRSLEQFHRTLKEAKEIGLIPAADSTAQVVALDHLEQSLKQESRQKLLEIARRTPYEIQQPGFSTVDERIRMTPPMREKMAEALSFAECYDISTQLHHSIDQLQRITPANFLPALEGISAQFAQLYSKGYHDELIFAFNRLMRSLPLPRGEGDYWQAVHQRGVEAVTKLITQFAELQHLFFKSNYFQQAPERTDPECVHSFWKLLAIQDRLISLDARRLGMDEFATPPDFTELCQLLRKPFPPGVGSPEMALKGVRFIEFHLTDPALQKSLQQVYDYFSKRAAASGGGKLAFAAPVSFNEQSQPFESSYSYDDLRSRRAGALNPEFAFIRRLLKSQRRKFGRIGSVVIPGQDGLLNRNRRNFSSLDEAQQIAIVYGQAEHVAAYLPPLFAQWRRQVWEVQHFMAGPIERPSSFLRDPEKNLEIECSSKVQNSQKFVFSTMQGYKAREWQNVRKRFENSSRPIYELSGLRDLLRSNPALTENEVMRKELQGLTLREFRELATCATNPDLQVLRVLSSMRADPLKLEVPDYQALFWMLCTEGDVTARTFERSPLVAIKAVSLIRELFETYTEQGNIFVCRFLLALNRYFLAQWAPVAKSFPNEDAQVRRSALNNSREIETLQRQKSLTQAERSLLAQEWIVSQAVHGFYADQEIRSYLIAMSQSETYPVMSQWRDTELEADVARVIKEHREQLLQRVSADPARFLSAVLDYYGAPNPNATWKMISTGVFASSDGVLDVDILTGRTQFRGKGQTQLPKAILENGWYRSCFSKPYLATSIGLNRYFFRLEDGSAIRIEDVGGSLVIEREIQGEWYQLAGAGFPCSAISNKCERWMPSRMDATECYFSDRGSGQLRYKATFARGLNPENPDYPYIRQVTKTEGGATWSLVDIYDKATTSYDWLFTVESPSNVMVWQSDQGIRIELHRFDLTLYSDGDRWLCTRLPGYWLSNPQHVEPLELMGQRGYLQFENERGEQRVLVPKRRLKRVYGRPLSTKPEYESDQASFIQLQFDREPARYDTRRLTGATREGFYLAYLGKVSATSAGFEIARSCLRPSRWRVSESPAELAGDLETLAAFIDLRIVWQDADPRATALHLHAMYLFDRLLARYDKESEKGKEWCKDFIPLCEKLSTDLLHYVETLKHSISYHLPVHEFVKLCQLSSQNRQLHPTVLAYLQEIAPDKAGAFSSQPLSMPRVRRVEPGLIAKYNEAYEITYKLRDAANISATELNKLITEKAFLLTRPGKHIFALFLHYLPVAAATGGKGAQGQELRDILSLTRHDQDPNVQILRGVLYAVMDNRALFRMTQERDFWRWGRGAGKFIRSALESLDEESETPAPSLQLVQRPGGERRPRPLSALETVPSDKLRSREPAALFQREAWQEPTRAPKPFAIDKYLRPLDMAKEEQRKVEQRQKLAATAKQVDEILDLRGGRVLKQEMQQLQQGSKDHVRAQEVAIEAPRREIDRNKTKELILDVEAQIDFLRGRVQAETYRLEAAVNGGEPDFSSLVQRMLLRGGNLIETLTVNDILICFGRGDFANTPPHQARVMDFLRLTKELQKLERMQARLEDYQRAVWTAPEEAESCLTRVLEEFEATRPEGMRWEPQLMVLEYWFNLLGWSDQIHMLDYLIEQLDRDPLVVQMIMGAGKTSILMTLMAILRADGVKLSGLMAAKHLLAAMGEEMRQRIGRIVDQLLVPFYFDRNGDYSPARLKEVIETFEQVRRDKQCWLMDPESALCFYLKYIEILRERRKGDDETLDLMGQIMMTIFPSSRPLIDEVHLPASPFNELNFTVGEELVMPDEEQDASIELYQLLLSHSEVTERLRCEFSPSSNPNAPLFIDETWKQEIKPRLGRLLLRLFAAGEIGPVERRGEIATFFRQLNRESHALIECYLSQKGDRAQIQAADAYVAAIASKEVKNILALGKEELQTLLPSTLTRRCDDQYGPSETALAVPYELGARVYRASFANPHEAGNYTTQLNMKHPIPSEFIRKEMAELKQKVDDEKRKGIPFRQCPTHQRFLKTYGDTHGFNILRLNERELMEIESIVNGSPALRGFYIRKYLLPQLRFYARKLTAHAQMFSWFFPHHEGFSGTVAGVFPQAMRVARQTALDAKTLFVLAEQCAAKGGLEAVEVPDDSEPTLRQYVVKECQEGRPVHAVLDQGGWLNALDLTQVAAGWRKALDPWFSGVVYHNQSNVLTVQERTDAPPVPHTQSTLQKDQRLVLARQCFTTGFDMPYALSARAVMPINKTITFMEFAQTYWRMRGVGKGQTITFLVPRDVAILIRSTLHLASGTAITGLHIAQFALINQCRRQEDASVLGTKQEMKARIQYEIFKVLLTTHGDARRSLYTPAVDNIFAPEQPKQAYDMYGRLEVEEPSEKMLADYAKHCVGLLKAATENNALLSHIDLDKVEGALMAMIRPENLPELSVARLGDNLSQKCLVQQRVQAQTKVTTRVQTYQRTEQLDGQEKRKPWIYFAWPEAAPVQEAQFYKIAPTKETPYSRPLKDWVSLYPKGLLKPLADALDPRIKVSYNFATPKFQTKGERIPRVFDSMHKRTHFLYVTRHRTSGDWEVHIADQYDAQNYLRALSQAKGGDLRVCLYDLDLGLIQSTAEDPITDAEIEGSRDMQQMLAQVSFCAGRVPRGPQRDLLRTWMTSHDTEFLKRLFIHWLAIDPQPMLDLFTDEAPVEFAKGKLDPSDIKRPEPDPFELKE